MCSKIVERFSNALIPGGLPALHRHGTWRERRGVIRPRVQGTPTGAPAPSPFLARMQYHQLTNQQTKVCRSRTNGMVKHLHVTLNDEDYERLKAAKDDHGGTWEEWLLDQLETQPGEESN